MNNRALLATLLIAALLPATSRAQWVPDDHKDEMRGTTTQGFQTRSLNRLEFPFPYQGGAGAALIVRKTRGKEELVVLMEKGQILCHLSDCSISVKFDAGTVKAVRGAKPDNGRSDAVFLGNAAGLIAEMRKAKTMMVEIPFYQTGRGVLKFNVEKLPPFSKQ